MWSDYIFINNCAMNLMKMWCSHIKWVWSHTKSFLLVFYIVVLDILNATFSQKCHKNLLFIFRVTSNWRFCKTIENKRKFFLVIGYILKSIFVSSDSFCLITSQITPFLGEEGEVKSGHGMNNDVLLIIMHWFFDCMCTAFERAASIVKQANVIAALTLEVREA